MLRPMRLLPNRKEVRSEWAPMGAVAPLVADFPVVQGYNRHSPYDRRLTKRNRLHSPPANILVSSGARANRRSQRSRCPLLPWEDRLLTPWQLFLVSDRKSLIASFTILCKICSWLRTFQTLLERSLRLQRSSMQVWVCSCRSIVLFIK